MSTILKTAVESYLRAKTVSRGTRNEYFSTLRKLIIHGFRLRGITVGFWSQGRCFVTVRFFASQIDEGPGHAKHLLVDHVGSQAEVEAGVNMGQVACRVCADRIGSETKSHCHRQRKQ